MSRRAWLALIVLPLCALLSAHGGRADPLRAGGLQSLPEQRTQSVDLTNPGFEDEWSGWQPERQQAFSIAQEGAHSGEASLRLDAGAQTQYVPSLRQSLPEVAGGVYNLRFWVRTVGVEPPEGKRAGVRVSLEYHLRDGGRVWPSTSIFSGTEDWQPVELQALVRDDLAPGSALISVHRYGPPTSGSALFDEFVLERVLPPPVGAFLLYPNYRGYLPVGDRSPQRVSAWLRVNDTDTPGPARLEVTEANTGRKVASAELPAGRDEGVVDLDATDWPVGSYTLRASLGQFEYPPYLIQRIPAEEQQEFSVWLDHLNVLHLNGRPTFPFGLYNTVEKFGTVSETDFARLDEMAEAQANFQINYWWWNCGLEIRRSYLAEMQRRGIWYLDTVNNVFPGELLMSRESFPIGESLVPDANGRLETQEQCDRYLSGLAAEMRKLVGHAGWYVMDERPFGKVPAQFHQYCILREADPDHPTFGVSNRPAEIAFWRDTLDIVGLDPYPLFNMNADTPLTQVGDWTRAGVEATHGNRPVWIVIQFFQGWSTDRWPTQKELRTMSLMAITEGARGLFYWSYGARGLATIGDPEVRENHRQRLIAVVRELKQLEPALIAPDAPDIIAAVSDARVRCRAREAEGKWYVFAYLPASKFSERGATDPVEVAFTLRDGRQVTRPFRPDTADWFAVNAGE